MGVDVWVCTHGLDLGIRSIKKVWFFFLNANKFRLDIQTARKFEKETNTCVFDFMILIN